MGYGVIPDLAELKRWLVNEGLSAQEASERYAARGERVPAGTIRVARHRNNWGRVIADHTRYIPWQIKPEHARRFDHVMLEAFSRRQQGMRNTPQREKELDRWLQRLDEQDAVVHYHPDHGWVWVPRRPGIDGDVISMPDLDDEGELARLRPGAEQLLRRVTAGT